MASEEVPGGFSLEEDDFAHPSRLEMWRNNILSDMIMAKDMKSWGKSCQYKLGKPTPPGREAEALRKSLYFDRPKSPAMYWGSVVEICSRMPLTKDTDRPVAIMGIVDVFRPFLGEYLAGMWRELLPRHLMWSTRDHKKKHPLDAERNSCYRPSAKRAPTWSWLSVEGAVFYQMAPMDRHKDVVSRVLDFDVMSAQDIRLRIQGPLVPDKWVDQPTGFLSRASFQACKLQTSRG